MPWTKEQEKAYRETPEGKERRRQMNARWRVKNPDYKRRYREKHPWAPSPADRARAEAHKETLATPVPCGHCGENYTRTALLQKYCSPTCRRAAKYSSDYHRRAKYGVTADDFAEMMEAQKGRCDACGVVLTEGQKTTAPAHVDHDHQTERVRGILCRNCNLALGLLGDSPMRVSALLDYIGRHSTQVVWDAEQG